MRPTPDTSALAAGTLRRLWAPIAPYRGRLLAGAGVVLLVDGCDLMLPTITRSIVDLLTTRDPASIVGPARWLTDALGGAGRLGPARTLLVLGGLYLALAIGMGCLRYAWRMLFVATSYRAAAGLRRRLLAHVQRLPVSRFDHTPTGDLMARATNDLDALRLFYGIGLLLLVDTPIYVIAVPVILFWINPWLTLWILPLLAVLPVLVRLVGTPVRRRFTRIQEAFSRMSARAQSNLAGIRVVKAFNREQGEGTGFDKLAEEYCEDQMSLARLEAPFYPAMESVVGAAVFVVLLAGGRSVLAGDMSAGELVAYWQWLLLLSWPSRAIAWTYAICQRAIASLGRINEVLAWPAESEGEPAAAPPGAPLPEGRRIQVRDLHFRYPGTERSVLSGVSLDLERGSITALIGRVGGGKSTVAALLSRLYDPPRGTVFVDGVDLLDVPRRHLRSLVSVVPQESFLFSMSIAENVRFGAGPSAGNGTGDDALARVLHVSGIAEEVAALPQGVDSALGERGVNLSGGQRQRLTIARALAADPPVLVLDDCLSSVDAGTERRILDAVRGELSGRATLLITHRLAAAREADRILVLEDGRIVEQGHHDDLVALGGRYAAMDARQRLADELDGVS